MLGMEKWAAALLLSLQAVFDSQDVSVSDDKPFPSELLLFTGVGWSGVCSTEMSDLLLTSSMTLSPSPAAILLPKVQQLFLGTFIFGNYH